MRVHGVRAVFRFLPFALSNSFTVSDGTECVAEAGCRAELVMSAQVLVVTKKEEFVCSQYLW